MFWLPFFVVVLRVLLELGECARQQQTDDFFENASKIVQSEGPWEHRMPEEWTYNFVLPFIRQFRRQLRPQHRIEWVSGANALRVHQQQQNEAHFTHVDLDPKKMRKYRKTRRVESMHDLGGLVLREMWKQAKHRCIRCENHQCELVDPECGLPYQLFDEKIQHLYCEITLAKLARQNARKMPPLRAKMQCITNPPSPTLHNSQLASIYTKSWQLMCINCHLPGHQQENSANDGRPSSAGAETDGNSAEGTDDYRTPPDAYRIPNNNDGSANNRGNNHRRNGANTHNNNNNYYYQQPRPAADSRQQRVLRVPTSANRTFSLKYQINAAEGQAIVNYTNQIRAKIARGEVADLPIASAMNKIKWKQSLASEALNQLGSSQNRAVHIADLDLVRLMPGYGSDSSVTSEHHYYGSEEDEEEYYGSREASSTDIASNRNRKSIELKATDVLLMTLRNYLEMFTGQQGLDCSQQSSCRATCTLSADRAREAAKREDDNPSDHFCYPYELLYDHAVSIGCAARFSKRGTELRGKLVCMMSTQHGHKKMLHHHHVYRAGSACTRCEAGFGCDAQRELCVKNGQQRQTKRQKNF